MQSIGRIKNFVDKFALTISDVLDTDVLIIDNELNIVGSAFKFLSLYNDIKYGTLIAEVLRTDEIICIADKAKVESCKICKEYKSCKMKGFIGVPIRYKTQVVGVIALILKKNRTDTMFERLESIITFMENMANLVAVHIYEHDTKKGLISISGASLVTFDWLLKYVDESVVDKAKRVAKTDKNVLIYSEDNSINELIAKATFNQSSRKLHELRVIYMQNVYRDLLNRFLMDSDGLLETADEATFIIVQPERMTLYVQDQLATYIERQELLAKKRKLEQKIRFLFCTTYDLKILSLQGLFSLKLYDLISKNQINNMINIHNNKELFARFIKSGVQYYNKVYEREHAKLADILIREYADHLMKYEISSMELLLERIVKTGKIELDNSLTTLRDADISTDEFERVQIEKFLYEKKSKSYICKNLGISRSTLYRKLKNYGLSTK